MVPDCAFVGMAVSAKTNKLKNSNDRIRLETILFNDLHALSNVDKSKRSNKAFETNFYVNLKRKRGKRGRCLHYSNVQLYCSILDGTMNFGIKSLVINRKET